MNYFISIYLYALIGDVPYKRLQSFIEYFREEKYLTTVKQEQEHGINTAKSSMLKNFDFDSHLYVEKVADVHSIIKFYSPM